MGLEASINEDAFDLDDLTEDENDDVADPTAAGMATDVSTYHSTVPEVGFIDIVNLYVFCYVSHRKSNITYVYQKNNEISWTLKTFV